MRHHFEIVPGVSIGGEKPLIIAGPCVVESWDICAQVAEKMKEVCAKLGLPYVFKASFDKANRTSDKSFRSIGMQESLKILQDIRKEFEVPVITDVHETIQVAPAAEVVDLLQIPAFLCRQTDLLIAAGNSAKPVNVKKGQFMAPEDMQYAVDKIKDVGNDRVSLTERGSSFGYHNLVVDMRSLAIMRQFAPVIFDVTHSVQMPGGLGGSSGGQREFAPLLARAAAAAGVDGFFIETHPNPAEALSDGPNSIPLIDMEEFLLRVLAVWIASRE
jgi:2-dehydro-3-deoxyphosphooctonate aldolase (KDO 8-P synthase)